VAVVSEKSFSFVDKRIRKCIISSSRGEKSMNGYELIAELERVIRDIIVVPNEWLPEDFRDNRTDGVSLADLERKCDARDSKETDHQIEKREKDKRIEIYSTMIENCQEITYLPK
jgi:hypothetical protein